MSTAKKGKQVYKHLLSVLDKQAHTKEMQTAIWIGLYICGDVSTSYRMKSKP